MDRVNPAEGPNEHRHWREMLGAYVLGELDEERQAALQAHLDGCEHCRAQLREIEPVAAALAEADPRLFGAEEPRPPRTFWSGPSRASTKPAKPRTNCSVGGATGCSGVRRSPPRRRPCSSRSACSRSSRR